LTSFQKLCFIAGFFDADGTVAPKEIAIYDGNKLLLTEISRFLSRFKIKSKVTPHKKIFRLRIRSSRSIKRFITLMKNFSFRLVVSNPVGEGRRGESQVS